MKPSIKNVKTTKINVEQHECFTIVLNESAYIITIGNNVVSREKFKTLTKAKQYINSKPYELLINTACLIAYQTIKEQNKNENQPQQNEHVAEKSK